MKMKRLISLLFVVIFVLTTFSGAFVYGDDPDVGEVIEGTEGTEGEDVEEEVGADFTHENGALVPVDAMNEENKPLLTAAEKAANGRSVTVYEFQMWKEEFSVERVGDFVGVFVYDSVKMTALSLAEASTNDIAVYNLKEQKHEQEDGTVIIEDISAEWLNKNAYLLEITAVSSAEIAQLATMTDPEKLEWKKAKRGKFTSEAQRVSAMENYGTVGDLTLYVDEQLGEIAIHNNKTGDYFFSNPYDYNRVTVPSVTTKSQLASLLELEYYDNSANKKTLYSYDDGINKTTYADPDDPDTVDNIQFWAEKLGEGSVRLNFEIGSKELDTLLPYAAEVTSFNAKVLDPLKAMADAGDEYAKLAYSKLIAFYNRGKVYSYDELSASLKQSIAMEFPGIKNHDFYILRTSGLYNRDKLLLSDYIRYTKLYTQADFDYDLELSGYEPEENFFACFKFYMDITIEDGNMKVNIPTDNISYDKEHFTLTKISPLRYFGSGKYSEDGFVFIPDGSGVVIDFNKIGLKSTTSLSKMVYGDDYSLLTHKTYNNLSQTAYMPVFGLKAGTRAYLAVIEKGDALATVQSETGNLQSPFESAYATFTYRTVQTINYTDGTKQNGEFTYFPENTYTGGFALRYLLICGNAETDYVDMAVKYREYLVANGRLVNGVNTSANANVPLVLETLGMIDKKESFFGIIYDKKIAMTTFEDAQNMINTLSGEGVGNVSLRYRGWVNGGLNYSVPNKMSIVGKLGGKSGFRNLISFMAEGGYSLYPEIDFNVVRRDGMFDGYSVQNNGPKMTDRTTVTLTPRNELDNVGEIDKNYFAVSPSSATKYYKAFFGKYNAYNAGSISLGTVGSMLFSDFSKNEKGKNRQEALDILNSNIATYVTGGGNTKIMVEGGNAYTWSYATEIVDMPLSGSNTLLADRSVPFMQIVLHGHIQYAGTAINMADNMTNTILKSAEYGANLHFTLSAQNTRELKETVYSNYFTLDFDTWKADVIAQYAKFNAVFATLQDKEITDHAAAEGLDNVFITTYSNGTKVVVNYNRTDVTVDGKTIAAQDFAVL